MRIASALEPIFKDGIFDAPYASINLLANYLSKSLGVEVSIGSEARDCSDAGYIKNLVIAIPAGIEGCVVLVGRMLQIFSRIAGVGELLEDKGQLIFRVLGGQASMEGRSWTPVNPIGYPDYRDAAGLPKYNSCTSMVMGIVRQSKRGHYIIKNADSIKGPGDYYVKGGLIEYEFMIKPFQNLGIIEYGRVVPMTPPC